MKRIQWSVIAMALTVLAQSANGAFLVSEKEVLRQARVEWLQMKRHVPLESDPRVQRYVECIANNIIAELPPEHAQHRLGSRRFRRRPGQRLRRPNGKIGVFSGILKVADTPDALAAVIGHEVAHATEGPRDGPGAQERTPGGLGHARRCRYRRHGFDAGGPRDRSRVAVCPRAGNRRGPRRPRLHGARRGSIRGPPSTCGKTWRRPTPRSGNERPPEFLSTHPSDSTRIDNMIKSLTPALVKYTAAREAGKRPACTMAAR